MMPRWNPRSAPPPPEPQPPPEPPADQYEVEPGDTWETIAVKVMGDPAFAGELQAMNPGVSRLEPGMVINIPALEEEPPPPEGGEIPPELLAALMGGGAPPM